MAETKQDPRDELADWYEADPSRYTPMSFFNPPCPRQAAGLEMLRSGCPAGALYVMGVTEDDPLSFPAEGDSNLISRWVVNCLEGDPDYGIPDSKDLSTVLEQLRTRAFPFDDATLNLESETTA